MVFNHLFVSSSETNLKARQCDEVTNKTLGQNEHALSEFHGHIVCEAPNNNLSRFEGKLTWDGGRRTIPVDNEKMLYR